jgi:hypothetical protein
LLTGTLAQVQHEVVAEARAYLVSLEATS